LSKKIIISESQYRRVFLSEDTTPIIYDDLNVYESESIIVEQNDESTGKKVQHITYNQHLLGTAPNYKIIPNKKLDLTKLIPKTKIDPCRPPGLFGYAAYAAVGEDWCEIMSSANIDCYMGFCTVEVDGKTYTWNQRSSRSGYDQFSNKDNQLILNQNYQDFNKYILNFNKNIIKWNSLKKLSKWGGEAILIDDEWLSENSNNLQKIFDRNSYLGYGYVGIGTTNIFNPGWLIQRYIEIETAIEFDLISILKQEEFSARLREAQKEYNEKVEVYQKQMEVWKKYISNIYNERKKIYSDNNRYLELDKYRHVNVRQEENYPQITPINIDFFKVDNNNPFGGKSTTTRTKTEEEEFINTYDYKPKLKPEGGKEGIKKFQDWLDSKNLKWVDGANLNKGPGYGNWGSITKSLWPIYGVIYEWETKSGENEAIPNMPKMPDRPDILGDDYARKDLSELELALESFKILLSAIDSFNSVFETQNYNDTVEFCNTRGKRSQFGPIPKSSAILINKGTPDVKYLYWYFNICPGENGGVWVYSQGPNSKSCGCVRTPKQDNLYSSGQNVNFAKTLAYRLENTDLRSGFEKLSDWASGCMDDWHCLADIASIAVLFIPVPGLNVGLSAAIDLVSATGYALEGDEGWELNAGLTLLGSFASGIDAIKYVNEGLKGGSEITRLRKSLGEGLINAEKVKLSPEWSKLDKVSQSKLYSKEFRKSLKGLSSKEIRDLSNIITSFSKSGDELVKSVNEIIGDISNLSKQEKAAFQDILNKMAKDDGLKREIANHIIANGSKVDVKSILKTFGKQSIVKDALVQSTLFVLMQKYPEETAKFIIGGLELFRELTGIDLLKKLSNHDKDTEDSETKSIEEIILQFQNYEKGVNLLLSYLKSTGQKEIKDKYGVDLYDLYGMIFNKTKPLFPDQLIELTNLISSFITDVNSKENEKPPESPENIKLFVKEQFDLLKQFIEDDRESEQNLKDLWDIYKNNPPKDADLYFDNYEDYRQLQKDIELLDNM
jgi:hypothetical protein